MFRHLGQDEKKDPHIVLQVRMCAAPLEPCKAHSAKLGNEEVQVKDHLRGVGGSRKPTSTWRLLPNAVVFGFNVPRRMTTARKIVETEGFWIALLQR